MRDGGRSKEVVYGGNLSPEHLWRFFFSAGFHSFALTCPVITVFLFASQCQARSLSQSVNHIVTEDGN